MGIHWGSAWFQVKHKNLNYCGIILLSKYPAHTGEIKDGFEVCEFIPPQVSENFSFIHHDTKEEAVFAAKFHALEVTKKLLPQLQSKMLSLELENQNNLFVIKKGKAPATLTLDEAIVTNNEVIANLKTQISTLKRLRNKKTAELLEDDIRKFDTLTHSEEADTVKATPTETDITTDKMEASKQRYRIVVNENFLNGPRIITTIHRHFNSKELIGYELSRDASPKSFWSTQKQNLAQKICDELNGGRYIRKPLGATGFAIESF